MARQLRKAGWTKARALVGGWHAWREAGLPVEPRRDEDVVTVEVRGQRATPD